MLCCERERGKKLFGISSRCAGMYWDGGRAHAITIKRLEKALEMHLAGLGEGRPAYPRTQHTGGYITFEDANQNRFDLPGVSGTLRQGRIFRPAFPWISCRAPREVLS
jgi:hypothetical protein